MSNYEKVKEWRKKNPEKVKAQHERYRKKNPEKVKEKAMRYRLANLEKVREQDKLNARKRRKQDPEGQRRRYEKWRNKKEAELWDIAGRPRAEICELCDEKGLTVFDHCHNKGHFRGWICDRCNRVLGCVKDDIKILRNMIAYLEKNDG